MQVNNPPRKVAVFGGEVEEVERILELIPAGYEIEKAPVMRPSGKTSGQERPALAIVLKGNAHPGGWHALRKAVEKCGGAPVLAVAPRPSCREVIEAFRAGASDFLVYPPPEEEFRAVFYRLVEKAGPREGVNSSPDFCKEAGADSTSNDDFYDGHENNDYGCSEGRGSDCQYNDIALNEFGRSVPVLLPIQRPARLATWLGRLKKWLWHVPARTLDPGAGLYSQPEPEYEGPASKVGGIPSSVSINDNQPGLSVSLFGPMAVFVNGRPLKRLPGKKVNALLAFFLHNHQKPVHREILMEKFWGGHSPSSARNSLNVAVYTIRKHLARALPDTDVLLYDNDYYQLNPGLHIVTDVQRFLAFWKRGRNLEASRGLPFAVEPYQEAAQLYTGDFLSGLHYEEWCESERDNLKETFLFILERLCTYAFQHADYQAVAGMCARMLQKDPCLEEIHRKLIVAFYQMGQRDKAVRQYYKCIDALRRELDVGPSPQTQALFGRIRKGEPGVV